MKSLSTKSTASVSQRRARSLLANLRPGGLTREKVIPARPRGEFWTDDELLALSAKTDLKWELWAGKIIVMPTAGVQHGAIIARLLAAIATNVYEHKFGEVFDGQTGFRLSVDHCFAPDIAVVSRGRLKFIGSAVEKLFHGAPDFAVEVLSPSDSITKTERKLNLFFMFGARLAWMIDPKNKTARVYRKEGEFELLRRDGVLTANSLLPGLRIPLSRVFEDI